MDYDRTDMAAGYDAGRSRSAAATAAWMARIAAPLGGATVEVVLDLGCGTGRYTAALAAHFEAQVIGVEPSAKMLAEARAKQLGPGVRLLRGAAERLPLAGGTVDLVFLSMVFHHLADRVGAMAECRRVLRPGGHLAIRTPTVEQIPSYPHLAFFPSAEGVLRRRMPARQAVVDACVTGGLAPLHREAVAVELAEDWPAYVTRVGHRADSILVSIPDAEFAQGLAAMAAPGAVDAPRQAVMQEIDLQVFCRAS